MQNILKLAKKIRKPGENWQKCIQRARKHLNNQNVHPETPKRSSCFVFFSFLFFVYFVFRCVLLFSIIFLMSSLAAALAKKIRNDISMLLVYLSAFQCI